MDYKTLIDDLRQAAEMNFISCPDNAETCINAATAITDLLARAETAEAQAEKAERERDAAIKRLRETFMCAGCKNLDEFNLCKIGGIKACYQGNDRYEFAVKEE